MSLATRCVSCGTVFRVVQDQLKVSEGWVRCGRCEHVFNALDSLFDLEREAPPPWKGGGVAASGPGALAAAPAPAPVAAEASAAARDTAEAAALVDDAALADAQETSGAALLTSASAAVEPPIERPRVFTWSRPGALDGTPEPAAESELPTEILGTSTGLPSEISTEILAEGMPPVEVRDSDLDSEAEALAAAPAPTPEFVRRAQAAERWQRPRTRIGLALLGVLLALVLVAQLALHERDWIAARFPSVEPALSELCGLFDCRIEALRRIDALAVESSGLTRLDGGNVHRLGLSLRNHDSLAVQLPAVELSLTDTRGQVVARRVLTGADFGLAQSALGAGRDINLQALLDTGERRVAGYSIELFYP